jgi:hypothetical protein
VARSRLLADMFETKSTSIIKPVAVCAAADKNGEGVVDPTAHLACYRIKDTAGQAKLAQQNVSVGNQFGGETQTITKPATSVRTDHAQWRSVDAPARPLQVLPFADGSRLDALRTQNRDARRRVRPEDHERDQAEPAVRRRRRGRRRHPRRGAALACYRIKDASGQPKLSPIDVGIDDEFGARNDTLLKPSMLCVPSIATHP